MTREEKVKIVNAFLDNCRNDGDEIEDNGEWMSDDELDRFIEDNSLNN